MNMHHHAPLHQQPQDTLSSHGRDLVSYLAIFFANRRNPIYSVEIPIITTCTEIKSSYELGCDDSRCRLFSEFEIRELGNRPVQWDWMEKCLFGASYYRWRFPESLWLKCQGLHFEQLAKKHPSFSQLYYPNVFGLAFLCIPLLQDKHLYKYDALFTIL